MSTEPVRLPTYFISHGGGPWPWIKDLLPGDLEPMERHLQAIPADLGLTPRVVLVVSAHWEEREFTVQTSPQPTMYYDYGGFPEFTYHLQYPSPGSPEVADRVRDLLTGAGITSAEDAQRGYDHGAFVPLAVMYPEASVPVLQLSIRAGYNVDDHLALGRALAPLRDEGVLIVGSGFTFHNMRAFGEAGRVGSAEFDAWLKSAVVDGPVSERTERLRNWVEAPSARFAHPAEDHLIPLHVVVGAAEGDRGVMAYHQEDVYDAIVASSYRFGVLPREQAGWAANAQETLTT